MFRQVNSGFWRTKLVNVGWLKGRHCARPHLDAMSETVTLGQLLGTYLRELVAQELLPREGVAVLLENGSMCDDLKERVAISDYGRLIAHLALQKQQGFIKDSVHDRLVIPLQTKLQPRQAKVVDFYAVPRPKVERFVYAVASFQGDEAQNQLSFEEGDVLLVLHAKEGAEWALGERVDNGVRGLYPVDFTAAQRTPRAAASAAKQTSLRHTDGAIPFSSPRNVEAPPAASVAMASLRPWALSGLACSRT